MRDHEKKDAYPRQRKSVHPEQLSESTKLVHIITKDDKGTNGQLEFFFLAKIAEAELPAAAPLTRSRKQVARSGTIGITWQENSRKWADRFSVGRSRYSLGRYKVLTDAKIVLAAATHTASARFTEAAALLAPDHSAWRKIALISGALIPKRVDKRQLSLIPDKIFEAKKLPDENNHRATFPNTTSSKLQTGHQPATHVSISTSNIWRLLA